MSLDEQATEAKCLTMFNRAVEYNDSVAWQFLHEHFSGMMHYWLSQYLTRDGKYYLESEENCIALAFERFWYAVSYRQQVHFETLASALEYLRTSLRSVAIDIVRAHKRHDVLSLQCLNKEEVFTREDDKEVFELWEEIKKMLANEREQRAAFLLFNCNLKPRQIVELLPQEFSDVQELYRVRRKVFERFTHNADALRWRLQG
jgi:DNA-directed RNA polymerase specialized sigma24 family protein